MSRKPNLTIILFKTNASDLSRPQIMKYGCTPYNLEKLQKQAVIGYGLMKCRVTLNVLSKLSHHLKQPDANKLNEIIKDSPTHHAHYIYKTHWLCKPIATPKNQKSSLKFLSYNDPIIISLRQNHQIKVYHKQYTIKYYMLTMFQTWIKEIQSTNKQWIFHEPIKSILFKKEKGLKKF